MTDSMDERIKRAFKKSLELNLKELDELEDDSSIHTVPHWDSLGHLKLITSLEEEFNITITDLEAIELVDVLEIKKLLKDKGIDLAG